MFLKFLKNEKTYEISSIEFINTEQIKIKNVNLPMTDGGFDVINNDIIDTLYRKYKIPYEKTDEYIIFTADTSVYYTYLVYDAESKFVTAQITTTDDMYENGILRKSGQGKEYAEPEQETIFDEDGFYLYKIVDGEIVSTTVEEKNVWQKEHDEEAFEFALASKLAEISTACNTAIIAGIDYNGKHFSYDNDDQKNINNAVQLAMRTGLGVPYHADGENCEVFSKEDIIAIYVAEETNLTLNTTYHNQLKLYVQTLGTKAEVEAVKYGETELVGSYKEAYDAMIAQVNLVIKNFVGKN
jgi:hypothetical protein